MGAVTPGFSFLGPSDVGGAQGGPLMVDSVGQPVWFRPLGSGQLASNVRVQLYRGKPVLTWWQGKVVTGYGQGEGVILDTSYREVARVRAARGRKADLHEFLLTPQGTALITCFPDTVAADLYGLGGPKQGHVLGSIIQEIDVATGRLLLEWRGLGHVALSESHASPWNGFDYLHVNSIDVTPDGNLLVGARHTWALYKLARRTGAVMWRLGGKRSDFELPRPARFSWQHDARAPSASAITMFDDGEGQKQTESQSRGLVLEIDARHKRAHMVRSYRHRQRLLSSSMGNLQALPNGHVIVGWGVMPWMSEFDAQGTLIADLRLPFGCQSYRDLRFLWSGTPTTSPTVAVSTDPHTGHSTVYVSWNGATGGAACLVRGGSSPSSLKPVAVAPRRGFETAIPLGSASGYAAVAAVNASGQELGMSRTVRL
jgi:Arylsulfotransferase (ASST)